METKKKRIDTSIDFETFSPMEVKRQFFTSFEVPSHAINEPLKVMSETLVSERKVIAEFTKCTDPSPCCIKIINNGRGKSKR